MPTAQIIAHVGRNLAAYGLQPVIDGWVLPRDTPEAIATGQQNATELLLGSTANEGTQLLPPGKPEALRAMIKKWFGTQAEPIAALYTGTDPDTATVAAAASMEAEINEAPATTFRKSRLCITRYPPRWPPILA